MLLLVLILLFVVFFSYLPSYSSKISSKVGSYFIQLRDEERNLRQQVRDLKAEQGAISMTDEFAKYMKLQRKIDKIVELVKKMGSSRSQKLAMFSMGVKVAINVLHGIVMLSLIVMYKNEPLYWVPEEWFMPLNRLISFPTGEPENDSNLCGRRNLKVQHKTSGIGVTCWILVCSSVVHRIKSFINVQPSSQEIKLDT